VTNNPHPPCRFVIYHDQSSIIAKRRVNGSNVYQIILPYLLMEARQVEFDQYMPS
jgi:hypothetical protein